MKVSAALAALASLALSANGCTFAVEHPALTAGIVGGTIGIATCEIGTDFEYHRTCGIVAGSAALVLGGITALSILMGGEGNTILREQNDQPVPQDPTLDQQNGDGDPVDGDPNTAGDPDPNKPTDPTPVDPPAQTTPADPPPLRSQRSHSERSVGSTIRSAASW